jgi:hypothetical protein
VRPQVARDDNLAVSLASLMLSRRRFIARANQNGDPVALSRRVFLYFVGAISVFGWKAPVSTALPALAPDDLVVVKGWILRREDLEHLPRA